MAPSAVSTFSPIHVQPVITTDPPSSYLLDRDLNTAPEYVIRAEGNHLILDNGRRIFDACGGAAVACLGHGNEEVCDAIDRQRRQVAYANSMSFKTRVTDSLAEELITSTGKKLERVYLICSGLFFKTYHHDD